MSGLRANLASLTTRGRCLLAAGLALTACSLVLGQRDLLRAAIFLVALPLLAVSIVARTRYRLACDRHLDPARVEVGRPCTVTLRLNNISRLPSSALLMEDALPYSLGGRARFVLDRVEPKGIRAVSYPVHSEVRGQFPVGPLSVRLTDPFGLCQLTRSFATTSNLIVTPVVTPLPGVRLGGDWAGGGGATSRSVAASGSNDAAIRDYRQGDDRRKIHWRSTARVGELMVRREEEAFQSRACLVLDSREQAHRGDGPGSSFEWAVSAAASIGVGLTRTGFALSLQRETGQTLGPSEMALTETMLLDALATVSPAGTQRRTPRIDRLGSGGFSADLLSTGGLGSGQSGGVLVTILGALDLAEAEQLSRLRAGSAVCVAVLLDTDSWAPGGRRARAEATEQHEQVALLLVAAGWRVLPVSHGTTLTSVWPLAGDRTAHQAPARPVTTGGPQ